MVKFARALRNAARQTEVLVLKGDGVGSEIVTAAQRVVDAARVSNPIKWTELEGYGYDNGKPGITQEHMSEFDRIGVLLKGPITIATGKKASNFEIDGKTFTSANQAMRRLFELYANIRPAQKFKLPWPTRFDDVKVDMVIVRENTEDLYCGKPEVWVDDDTCEATKRITRGASKRIAEVALRIAEDRAVSRGSALLTAVHKANVCKQTDGLFLEEVRKVAEKRSSTVQYDEALVDSLCAGMVMYPEAYDVLVAPNCWGDIVSDLAGGIVGSLGLLGSSNLGPKHALFEASHGSAPDIAGAGKVNPTSMILSGAMMLRHTGDEAGASAIEQAVRDALASGAATTDLGGKLSTTAFTDAVMDGMSS
eukprot:m.182665 g.182665  ORF g.182665 m.182665 type:complete len:365 (-) comp15593_c0_seq1:211-1305(-)